MIISLIAAMSVNGVIGIGGTMPWDQPEDLAYFRKTTKGHAVIMGRNTFLSIGSKPLPLRTNIVMTTDTSFEAEGVIVVHNLKDAINAAQEVGEEEVFIIGGGKVYQEAMEIADKLYITILDVFIDGGDTFFPDIKDWTRDSQVKFDSDEKNEFNMYFNTYIKNS